jgi:hypothetical protein
VLLGTYDRVESETGVVPGTDFIFGELQDALLLAVTAAAADVVAAPLAVHGSRPVLARRRGRPGWG